MTSTTIHVNDVTACPACGSKDLQIGYGAGHGWVTCLDCRAGITGLAIR